MSFSPNFTVAQITGAPSNVILTDTSTGSDILIAARAIYPIQDNGVTLLPPGTTTVGIEWPLVDVSITVENLLNKDYSLAMQVDWLDVSGVVLYTKTLDCNFEMYNQLYNYSLVNQEANGLASLNSSNWLMYRMALYVSLNDANTSVTDMSSITNGQNANDRGTYLRLNPNLAY